MKITNFNTSPKMNNGNIAQILNLFFEGKKAEKGLIRLSLFMGVAFFILFYTLLFFPAGCVHMKKPEKAEAEGCAACHGEEKSLPTGHVSTKGMALEACLKCHHKDSTRLTNKMPLSHTHRLGGVSCTDCHGEVKPEKPAPTDKCVSCHEIEKLVNLTREVEDANPHDSLHYGPDLDCDECHHIHRESDNQCAQCHSFSFVVPSPIAPLSGTKDVSKKMNSPGDFAAMIPRMGR